MFYLITCRNIHIFTRKSGGISSYVWNIMVKSERINAIRKQYDAFLEDDRKRKDRNKYILERLDKMRSCTSMVPIRHTQTINAFRDLKDHVNENANLYIGRTGPYEKQTFPFNSVDNSNILTTLKEETLVKELSKKYILIPKHQGTSGYEYKLQANPSVEDANDWRSKYSILEELKKSEKENEDMSKSGPNNETNLSYNNNKDFGEEIDNKATTINDSQNSKLITNSDDNFQELPNSPHPSLNNESEINSQNVDTERKLSNITKLSKEISIVEKNTDLIEDPKCNNNNIDNDQFADVLTEKEILQAKLEIESKPEVEDIHTNIARQEQTETLPKSVNDKPGENDEQMQSNINSSDDINEGDSSTVYQDNIDMAFKEPNYDLNFENTTDEISDNTHPVTNTIDEVQGLTKEEFYDESNVVIDNQEMSPEITENISHTINLDQQYEQHQTNSQKEYEVNVDETQIQNFEAEQNNMFYSEQAEDYTYDQTGEGNNANIEYTNNESYENNENYAYYEGSAQDQAYSDNINEREESTELYDPNYQKQYENYEQGDQQPENVEQFEATEYENQQHFDQTAYEDPNYNAVEEIQQQLDSEQGYEEPLKAVEGNLDDISPKEAIPENLSAENEVKNA